MMSVKTQHQEASNKWKIFDLVKWIRARRSQWLGHILCMDSDRIVKQAIFCNVQNENRRRHAHGRTTAYHMERTITYTCDRDHWRARVRGLKQPRVTVENGIVYRRGHHNAAYNQQLTRDPCCGYALMLYPRSPAPILCVRTISQHTTTMLTLNNTVNAHEVLAHFE